MPEDEMQNVQAPVEEPVENEKSVETGSNDLKVMIEELQDLVAEIVDVVDKIAEAVASVREAKEEVTEALKELKKGIEIMKAELPMPGEADKEEEKRRAENYPEGKEPRPTETGEEVKVTGEEINELQPTPKQIYDVEERPVEVEKGVFGEDEDVISKILKDNVGLAQIIEIEKSFVKGRR